MTATDTTTGRRSAAHTATAQDREPQPCAGRTTRSMPSIAATAAQVVRNEPCSRCGEPAGTACQTQPSADHARRWLDAYTAGLITRDQVADVITDLVVLTEWALVPATAAERAA